MKERLVRMDTRVAKIPKARYFWYNRMKMVLRALNNMPGLGPAAGDQVRSDYEGLENRAVRV
jgi:hypothetical protein